jgi:thioredoxin 1
MRQVYWSDSALLRGESKDVCEPPESSWVRTAEQRGLDRLMPGAVTITGQNLRQTVEQGGIVVLDFWAPWCGPCRSFAPTFEKAAGDNPDVVFGKVNTDEEQQLAATFEIQSIPTLMIFRDRVLLFRQAGALPPAALADVVAQAKALDMDHVRKEIAARDAAEKAAKLPSA